MKIKNLFDSLRVWPQSLDSAARHFQTKVQSCSVKYVMLFNNNVTSKVT